MTESATASSLSVQYDDNEKCITESEKSIDDLVRPTIKKTKAVVKAPTPLQRVFANKKLVKHHYFTAGVKINESNERKIQTEPSPFKYPKDLEEFSYRVLSKAWRDITKRTELKQKCSDKTSYRNRQNLDLLNRLYAKEPEIKSMKTITNVDPEFFSIVEGRPSPEKFDRREYIENVRDVLRTKIVTGYREDEILLINENFVTEERMLEKVNKEFQKYVDAFEEFLFNDHTLSMNVLRKSEEEYNKATEKYEIFKELSKDYGSLKSIVYNLEEKWRNCKMYQKFLYLMSPVEWRIENDFYVIRKDQKGEDMKILLENAQESSVFGRYKLASSGDVLSLEKLIDQFLDDVKQQNEPLLYFTTPEQLLKVFGFIEIQNLNSLLHSEELAVPLEKVKTGIEKMETEFNVEIAALQESIDNLEGGIIWEEQRAKYLEELAFELIYGDFKNLISNDEVINLYVFIEDTYESRIAPNDANLSMSEMMRVIEMTYRDCLLQLDRLPSDTVYKAEMECYREEARIMIVAKEAAKKVIQIEQLMKHLARLLEPPPIKTTKDVKWRSPPLEKIEKITPPQKGLTVEELDYLTFFADFCAHEDDPTDFGIRAYRSDK